jgi:hypothetical protein
VLCEMEFLVATGPVFEMCVSFGPNLQRAQKSSQASHDLIITVIGPPAQTIQ